ncbi:uncharacterized protein LOC103711772 [Phoenix dactylifera]|uniref:Uncharacterized protein LOC103711772 n=1 Tax=Phoenix dactylifera TaxID=42345 RepID=A0A8B7CCJ8_PHODC|nr:uncharacterized protein LOC103711772 [Phoenix dactylifera]
MVLSVAVSQRALVGGERRRRRRERTAAEKGDLRSTMGEVALWEEEDEEGWKCRKHPSQPRFGVCPACLRDRLLLLCPDCANVRPCGCFPPSSSSSSASSFSSLSADFARPGCGGSGIGAVGRVAHLIESEPAFRRSRSVGFQLLPSRSVATRDGETGNGTRPRSRGRRGWAAFWLFSRRKEERGEESRSAAPVKLSRSASVGVVAYPFSGGGGGGGGGGGRSKGWGFHFPSPMKAFRYRKSAKVVQQRSPICRR